MSDEVAASERLRQLRESPVETWTVEMLRAEIGRLSGIIEYWQAVAVARESETYRQFAAMREVMQAVAAKAVFRTLDQGRKCLLCDVYSNAAQFLHDDNCPIVRFRLLTEGAEQEPDSI